MSASEAKMKAETAMLRVRDAARRYPSVLDRIKLRWQRDLKYNEFENDWKSSIEYFQEMYSRRGEFTYMQAIHAETVARLDRV